MDEFLAFDKEDREQQQRHEHMPKEDRIKKREFSSKSSQSAIKRKREGIRQVPASSLLSTTSPWMEYAAHSFLSPNHTISEKRLAYWKHYASLHPIVQLHEEIIAFEQYISPTPSEMKARSDLLQRIDNVVQELWPGSKVSSFGSFYTQLYLPTSDVDLVVIGNSGKSGLRRLASELVKQGLAEQHSIKVISRARIPIIKFTEKKSKIVVDISFNQESGVEGSEKLRRLVGKWPGIRPLLLVLKQFLLNRGLNEVYSGGLSSYGLILLCVSFFQMHPMIQARLIRPEENLGVLLIEFFELFGKCLSYDRVGVSVLGRGSYFEKGERFPISNHHSGHLLAVEDPYDTSNDVTKASFSISVVRQAFGYAFEILTALVGERLRMLLDPDPERVASLKGLAALPPSLLSSIVVVPEDVRNRRLQ
ncbi:Non-canonical poly(A) RNA polymerase papd5 [Mitosporidium daphniae]